MIRIAQILSALFVLVLGSAGLTTIFSPMTILEPSGFEVASNYGITNLRTLGAPTLALAIITVIAIIRKEWLLVLPASAYFFLNFSARIVSVFAEGYESTMLFGILLTFTLFVLSQIALHTFRRAELVTA